MLPFAHLSYLLKTLEHIQHAIELANERAIANGIAIDWMSLIILNTMIVVRFRRASNNYAVTARQESSQLFPSGYAR